MLERPGPGLVLVDVAAEKLGALGVNEGEVRSGAGGNFASRPRRIVDLSLFASPQFGPMCGSTSPLSGAPGKVSAKPSIIACLRISAALLGLILADLQHDLVVQPRDRTALDPGLEQPVVDIGERQHRGVGAGALNRQIAAARVERCAFGDAALGK